MYHIETLYPTRAVVYTFEGGFYTHIHEITAGHIRLALLRCIASEVKAVEEGY